jgi:hypothetical protein
VTVTVTGHVHGAGSHGAGSWHHMYQVEASQAAAPGVTGGGGAAVKFEGSVAPSEAGLTQLRVPGDDRFSWTFVLQLLYPCCQMRRPPVTWHNLDRLLTLADKWCMASVGSEEGCCLPAAVHCIFQAT